MPIPNPNPITVPESAAQTFDSYWVSRISFSIPSATEGAGQIEIRPYDSVNFETLDSPEVIHIPNLWETMNNVPEVEVAIQAIINAVAAIKEAQ